MAKCWDPLNRIFDLQIACFAFRYHQLLLLEYLMDRNPKEMNDYILWSLVGGCIAFIVVLLSYMGFFSYIFILCLICRKVNCITSTTEEIILAYPICLSFYIRYSNISAPYSEIDHQNRLLRDKLTAISPDVLSSEATIHIYYDDPRFPTDSMFPLLL